MTDKTIPLYVVCSPFRCVGKTLVSRLLTEFYILDDRPVAAYDSADEGPQLLDYLPQLTTTADIGDIFSQMAFFERLIAHHEGAIIIDLSHRTFKNFFTIVEEIGFFEEARRHAIEPLILFMIDADPKSPDAYASLQRFAEASLLPVYNRSGPTSTTGFNTSPDVTVPPASLEIPLLGLSLRALIDRQAFSFCEFWRATPAHLPKALDDELRDWVEGIFFQFRKLDIMLGGVDSSTQIKAPISRRPRTTPRPLPLSPTPAWEGEGTGRQRGGPNPAASDQRPVGVPYEVLKFAPKRVPRDGVPADQFGGAIVEMLQNADQQLRAAENRISGLETEIESVQERAVRAESWLKVVQKETGTKLVDEAIATRSKIDKLGS